MVDDYGRETPVPAGGGARRRRATARSASSRSPAIRGRRAAWRRCCSIPPTVETDGRRAARSRTCASCATRRRTWPGRWRIAWRASTGRAVDLAARGRRAGAAPGVGRRSMAVTCSRPPVPENWVPLMPVRHRRRDRPDRLPARSRRDGRGHARRTRARARAAGAAPDQRRGDPARGRARRAALPVGARSRTGGCTSGWAGARVPGAVEGSSSLEFDTIDRGV